MSAHHRSPSLIRCCAENRRATHSSHCEQPTHFPLRRTLRATRRRTHPASSSRCTSGSRSASPSPGEHASASFLAKCVDLTSGRSLISPRSLTRDTRRSWNGVAGMFACWPMVGEFAHGFVSICGESHNVRTGTAFAPGQLCPFDVDGADPTQRLSTCAAPFRNYSTTGSCACCGPTPQCRLPHPWEPQISGNEIQAWETSKVSMHLLLSFWPRR